MNGRDLSKPGKLAVKKQTVKLPATISGQIDKLRERGCRISDTDYAREVLMSINYYRLVHYFEVFLDDKYHYKKGTTFEQGVRLYDFDRHLRNLFLVMLEEIEISLRAIISNYHALKYGALGYLNASTFDRRHKHPQFLSKIEHLIETNGSLSIVTHHKNKYGGFFPLWVIMEMFSFGTLTYFYQDMFLEDKKNIVEENFSGRGFDSRHLDSWLECLSDFRNRCAHYNRLYGNHPQLSPREPEASEYGEPCMNKGFFSYIRLMKFMCKRDEAWNSFANKLATLYGEYSDIVDLRVLGFPDNDVSAHFGR